MILNQPTFDRVRVLAAAINPRCTRVAYLGGRHDGTVAFRCVHESASIAPRAGFKLVVDEQFNVTSVENIVSFAGAGALTFRVTCSSKGRRVERCRS
jgi:hypothetical protein